MARYTLKSFCGGQVVERFEHRSAMSLRSILSHARFHRAGETGPFGEVMNHPDRFELFDNQMEKVSDANIQETLDFLKKLK